MHHDILLSSVPICLEWISYDPTAPESKGFKSEYYYHLKLFDLVLKFFCKVNYMAVGTLNPWIEIWDLDIMDSLEPEFILSGTGAKKNKKV